MTTTFKYTDLFLKGKDGEQFELIDATVPSFIGTKVVMEKTATGSIVMKKEGTHGDQDASSLVIPYGAFTSGTYARVNPFTPIKLGEAMMHLENEIPVYIDYRGEMVEVDERSYLDDAYGIFDFEDLMATTFYIKK
jgi:hypothetical protein